MRTFTKDTALSEQGRGPAWHVCINGTAWQVKGIGAACYVCSALRTPRSYMDRTDNEECVQLVCPPHRENGDGVGLPTSLHHNKDFSVRIVKSACGKPSSSIVDHVQE